MEITRTIPLNFDKYNSDPIGTLKDLLKELEDIYYITARSINNLDTGVSLVTPEECGCVGNGSSDDSDAFEAALVKSRGSILMLGPGKCYRITRTISAPLAGTYHIRGVGATYNVVGATTFLGSCILWDGDDPTDVMFDIGGGPIYISGVLQGSYEWQNNTTLEDFSILCNKGVKSLIYAHSQDNFTIRRIFVNGNGREDVRGVIDIRGTMSQPILNGITIYDVPKGYGIRLGDGACWAVLKNVAVQKTALCYWIGDTALYEAPWSVRGITFDTCSVEGSVINTMTPAAKFSIDQVDGDHLAGVTVLNVHDGTLYDEGDVIFIGRGDDCFEMNTVASISSNEITLVYTTEFAHSNHERVAIGTIGVHIGGGPTFPTVEVRAKHLMLNWVGCGIDAHNIQTLDLVELDVPSTYWAEPPILRVLYLDGDWTHVTLRDPYTTAPQHADYKFLEITNHANPGYFITWYGRLDRSGVTSPYQIDQSEIDGVYIGSDGIESLVPIPPKFRMLQMDYLGLMLRDTNLSPAGFRYSVGVSGSEVKLFEVGPSGTMALKDSSDNYIFSVDSDGTIYCTYRIQVPDSVVMTGAITAASAANSSIYVDSSDGKLYYKDYLGNSHALY